MAEAGFQEEVPFQLDRKTCHTVTVVLEDYYETVWKVVEEAEVEE